MEMQNLFLSLLKIHQEHPPFSHQGFTSKSADSAALPGLGMECGDLLTDDISFIYLCLSNINLTDAVVLFQASGPVLFLFSFCL